MAEGLASVQGSGTDLNTADALGWSTGTIKNVRGRANDLSLKLLSDAAHASGTKFIAPWLALLGYRAVPLHAACDTDVGMQPKLARLLLRVGEALDAGVMTSTAAKSMLHDLDAAQGVMDRIRRLAAA